ncbi:MAG: RNA-directed DNA polymerase, partial [Flavobacterium sp.]
FLDGHEVFDLGDISLVFKSDSTYSELSGLNAKAWKAEWADFTKKLYFKSGDFTTGYVAELDIANFYDSIQLDHLEYKLRNNIPHKQSEIIYLLLHFLRFWNRHINFYRQQGAGIPQDLFGECSRVLANFYLQSYDRNIANFCIEKLGQFFRYADDQVLFAQSKEDLEQMIAKASSLLMREGLNFNQKKVKIMTIDEFQTYYSFDNFIELAPQQGKVVPEISVIEAQVDFYLSSYNKLRKNGSSLLKRLINILSQIHRRPKNFPLLKKHILSKEFLLQIPLQHYEMVKIYTLLTKPEKAKMYAIILESVSTCLYSDRLYNVKQFFAEIKMPVRPVSTRITAVRRFYQLEPNSTN